MKTFAMDGLAGWRGLQEPDWNFAKFKGMPVPSYPEIQEGSNVKFRTVYRVQSDNADSALAREQIYEGKVKTKAEFTLYDSGIARCLTLTVEVNGQDYTVNNHQDILIILVNNDA